MLRYARLAEGQTNSENENQMEPHAKKFKLDKKITTIVTMDNDTMVEVFKYLDYYQLAKGSLVSVRFSTLICTNRHRLALLYVDSITMNSINDDYHPAKIRIFNNYFSSEAYEEWLIRNRYSKQIPFEGAGTQSKQNAHYIYDLRAYMLYKDKKRQSYKTAAFFAQVGLNHANWPVFQHFVRLLTDPFIYIHYLKLAPQNNVLNLLAGVISINHNRLQCNMLLIDLRGNMQTLIKWIKDHVRCHEFRIIGCYTYYTYSNYDQDFLDFFMTGADCTTEINVENYDFSEVIVVFAQKFMDFKTCDEYQLVESIRGNVSNRSVERMKRNYAKFIVKEERNNGRNNRSTNHVFEFVNNIGKKLQLNIVKILRHRMSHFTIKIINL